MVLCNTLLAEVVAAHPRKTTTVVGAAADSNGTAQLVLKEDSIEGFSRHTYSMW
jgi:hypothetical protein